MSTASTQTVRAATEAINALEAKGIEVAAVEFDGDEDTFALILAGGTIKEQGLGEGTHKDADE